MDKEFASFVNGETNYYKSGSFSIGRDKITSKDTDYYVVKVDDMIIYEWFGTLGERFKVKKSTGGKKPYAMTMLQEVEKGNFDNSEGGLLFLITPYIEWNSGRLINKRTKKPLKADEVQKIAKLSRSKFYETTKSLKDKGYLTVNLDGYFISRDLFKRGKSK